MKKGCGVVVVIFFVIVIGVYALSQIGKSMMEREATETANAVAPLMPEIERSFVSIVTKARDSYNAGQNEMAKGATRPARAAELCRLLKSPNFDGWAGSIATLSSNGDGKGILGISIGNEIYLTTWNNSLSDFADHTLIEPTTTLYQKAVSLKKGAVVKFSGTFIRNDTDCVKESSLSLSGSMTQPEFVVRFSDLTPTAK
jgi:hypothetical protein